MKDRGFVTILHRYQELSKCQRYELASATCMRAESLTTFRIVTVECFRELVSLAPGIKNMKTTERTNTLGPT